MELREQVRAKRRELGLTQTQIADAAGISLRTYQTFESGERHPQGGNLRAILRAVEINDADETLAEETREGWPGDVQVFLDVLGAYLATLSVEARAQFMRDLARRIFEDRA